MTFIFRLVVALIVFSFIVYVLKAISRLSLHLRGTIKDVRNLRDQISSRQVASADLVRCTSCGAFVSPHDAVKITSKNHTQIFCSHECLRAQAVN